MAETFRELVKAVRSKAGMTQAQLAERAHVSTHTINKIEKDDIAAKQQRKEVVISLALALEQNPEQWLTASGHEFTKEEISDFQKRFMGRAWADDNPVYGPVSQLIVEERELMKNASQGWQVWVIDSHPVYESQDEKTLEMVSDNVGAGIDYCYFYPKIGSSKSGAWGEDHEININWVRDYVETHAADETPTQSKGTVRSFGVLPERFPLFIDNVATVVFFRPDLPPAAQYCCRIIHASNPRTAWYYREEPSAVRQLVNELLKVMTESKSAAAG